MSTGTNGGVAKNKAVGIKRKETRESLCWFPYLPVHLPIRWMNRRRGRYMSVVALVRFERVESKRERYRTDHLGQRAFPFSMCLVSGAFSLHHFQYTYSRT